MSISTAFFVSPCLILFCIICSICNGKTNKLKLKLSPGQNHHTCLLTFIFSFVFARSSEISFTLDAKTACL